MNSLVKKVVRTVTEQKHVPDFSTTHVPIPAVNKAELYLTFKCNDRCAHCITRSGPERRELMLPKQANTLLENLAQFSVTRRLEAVCGPGRMVSVDNDRRQKLEEMKSPPAVLTEELKQDYSDALQGRGLKAEWITSKQRIPLNFSRPSIRLSGGEFFMWPFELNGRRLSLKERLEFQQNFLRRARERLPEYDIWILTNGRFVRDNAIAEQVIRHWSVNSSQEDQGRARTRICVSVDVFHRPPEGSSIEEMLDRLWKFCNQYNMSAPFLYGITNQRIGFLGRVIDHFAPGILSKEAIENVSGSRINPIKDILVDPVDLTETEGCREVKGFYFDHQNRGFIANDVAVDPKGHLVYCCACLGDYGDFLSSPAETLRRIVTDPISIMLRSSENTIRLMNTAVGLDPTIRVLGKAPHPAATASTCYQMMTGIRVPERRQ